MTRQLRPLIGKLDMKKLTPEEWDVVAERMDEYARNSAIVGILIGLLVGILIGIFL